MKAFKYALLSIMFTGLMVAGFMFDVPGARNIVTVLIWLNLVLAFLCLSDSATEVFRKNGRTVPENVQLVVFILRFCFLAWFGQFLLCAILFTGYLLAGMARYKAFDKKEVA